jgi:hypothetical protein
MRLTGATEDDLKIQIIKQFIIPFDTGIVVIRHWRTHNYIRSDRYKPTIYKSEKASLTIDSTGIYNVSGEGGTPLVDQMATVGSHVGCTGEGNKGKQSTGEQREGKSAITVPADHIPYSEIIDLFNTLCISFPKVTRLSDSRKKAIKARYNHYSLDDFKRLFEIAESSVFLKGKNDRNWTANFDWLIKDANMAKVLDGNYDNKASSKTSSEKDYDEPF